MSEWDDFVRDCNSAFDFAMSHRAEHLLAEIKRLEIENASIVARHESDQREIAALRERLEECRHELRGMSNVFFNLKQSAKMRDGEAERYQYNCERVAARAFDALRERTAELDARDAQGSESA